MDRRGVKTLLILLLLVTDLFLLGLWVSRERRTVARQGAMDVELEYVLAEAGLSVPRGGLPVQSARTLRFVRDPQMERAAAEALLGPCQFDDLGGGIIEYHSERGSARFRGMGEFEIVLTRPLPLEQPEAELAALARAMGLIPEESETTRLEHGENGYAFSEQTREHPIWDSFARFHLAEGALTGVEGQWLLGGGFTRLNTASRSAGWALLSLAQSLRDAGAGLSVLLDMDLGYRLSVLTPEIQLTPCWRVTLSGGTDDSLRVFYVNAVTGVPEPV